MDARQEFDYIEYFRKMCAGNRLAADAHFFFCTCSGLESLQGPLQEFRKESAFVCVDDTNEGALFRGRGGGWYKNRTITVFILHRYDFEDMPGRHVALNKCRMLFRQFVSRMLVDEDNLENDNIYLKTEKIMSSELGRYFLNGCTGLYFMIDVSEPVDLLYDSSEWLED